MTLSERINALDQMHQNLIAQEEKRLSLLQTVEAEQSALQKAQTDAVLLGTKQPDKGKALIAAELKLAELDAILKPARQEYESQALTLKAELARQFAVQRDELLNRLRSEKTTIMNEINASFRKLADVIGEGRINELLSDSEDGKDLKALFARDQKNPAAPAAGRDVAVDIVDHELANFVERANPTTVVSQAKKLIEMLEASK